MARGPIYIEVNGAGVTKVLGTIEAAALLAKLEPLINNLDDEIHKISHSRKRSEGSAPSSQTEQSR